MKRDNTELSQKMVRGFADRQADRFKTESVRDRIHEAIVEDTFLANLAEAKTQVERTIAHRDLINYPRWEPYGDENVERIDMVTDYCDKADESLDFAISKRIEEIVYEQMAELYNTFLNSQAEACSSDDEAIRTEVARFIDNYDFNRLL